ncbi:hypothetical protein [Nocardia terpenica]|nr:hypothetical protein [Nocardia terpenica]
MNRITVDDALFFRAHQLFGSWLANQVAWRFDEQLDRNLVERFHAHLAVGFTARRIVTTRIPFARAWWAPANIAFPLDWQTETIPESGVVDWLTRQGDVDFDPLTGRMWRLSVASVEGGGCVMAIACSHVAVDGGGGVLAVNDALTRLGLGAEPSRAESAGRLVGDTPKSGLLQQNLVDSLRQLSAVTIGVRNAVRARAVREPARPPRPVEPRLSLPERVRPATLVVEVPLAQWRSTAEAHSGTVNGLQLALAVGILGRGGRVLDGDVVPVIVPWSTRTGPDDPRGNATTGVNVGVPYRTGELVDLQEMRSAIKTAIAARENPLTVPPSSHLLPLMVMMPDFVARRGAKFPIVLGTSLRDGGDAVATVGGMRARSVVMRANVQPAATEFLRRTEFGMTISSCYYGGNVTFGMTAGDPDRFPTRAVLRACVEDEFTAWGLKPTFW